MYGPAFRRPVLTLETLRQIEQRIPGLTLDRIENQFYQIAHGQLHGLKLKLTYRNNRAHLEVGEEPPFSAIYRAERHISDFFPNHLPAAAWLDTFCELVPRLQRSPVRWEFTGVTTRDYRYLGDRDREARAIGEPETYYVTASTPEEGLARLRRLLGSEEFERAQIDPNPVQNDHHRWPDPEPVFSVLPEAS